MSGYLWSTDRSSLMGSGEQKTRSDDKQSRTVPTTPRVRGPNQPVSALMLRRGAGVRAGGPRNFKPPKRKKGKRNAGRMSNMTVGEAGALAMQAWQASKYMLSLLNVEQKFFDVSGTATPDSAGVFVNLSNIAQGDDVSNRTGDSILMRRWEFSLIATPGASSGRNALRVILFRDMQQDGVDPTPAQVLESLGANAVISPETYFYADGNGRVKRFQVMLDRVFTMTTGGYTSIIHFRHDKHFNGGDKHIWYDSTAGADASNREGMLGLLMVSDTTGAGNVPGVGYYNRIVYTDN